MDPATDMEPDRGLCAGCGQWGLIDIPPPNGLCGPCIARIEREQGSGCLSVMVFMVLLASTWASAL